MVAADRNSQPQMEKVLKLVAGVTEKIRQGRCSGELANHLMTACVGGIPTMLSETQIETWERHIRAVLRQKSGVQRSTSLGLLYDRRGAGLGCSVSGAASMRPLSQKGGSQLQVTHWKGGCCATKWQGATSRDYIQPMALSIRCGEGEI